MKGEPRSLEEWRTRHTHTQTLPTLTLFIPLQVHGSWLVFVQSSQWKSDMEGVVSKMFNPCVVCTIITGKDTGSRKELICVAAFPKCTLIVKCIIIIVTNDDTVSKTVAIHYHLTRWTRITLRQTGLGRTCNYQTTLSLNYALTCAKKSTTTYTAQNVNSRGISAVTPSDAICFIYSIK